MIEYAVLFARSARRELEKLEHPVARRIVTSIERLAREPRPPGCQKLQGGDLWRLRVGDYRIVYGVDDDEHVVDIVAVRHRREVYR